MPSNELARAIRDCAEIENLSTRVQAARAYRRRPQKAHRALRLSAHIPVVDQDGIIVALVTKAITTHHAIRVLAEQSLASDAMALQRVLLENVILLEWLLRDRTYRIDLYAESDELLTRHLAELTAVHYTHRPELVADAQRRAALHADATETIFGDTQKKWARRLALDRRSLLPDNVSVEAMFDEVAQPDNAESATPKVRSFMKEVVYFQASGFVHTNARALRKIARRIVEQPFFMLDVHRDDEPDCATALLGANLMALGAIFALNKYAGLGLDEPIQRVVDILETRTGPSRDQR